MTEIRWTDCCETWVETDADWGFCPACGFQCRFKTRKQIEEKMLEEPETPLREDGDVEGKQA